jgi:PAS domain S-box-containing protein
MREDLPEHRRLAARLAWRVALAYALAGAAWIFFSDWLLVTFVQNPAVLTQLQTLKGWAFVLVTSGLLYPFLVRNLRSILRIRARHLETERYKEAMLDASPAGILLRRADGIIVEASEAFAAMLGRRSDQIIGHAFAELAPGSPGAGPETHTHGSEPDGRPGAYEIELLRGDGRHLPALVRDRAMELRGERFIWSSVEDLTDRRVSAEALRESTEMLRALIRSSPLAIMAIDPQGRVMIWNAAAETIFGWSSGEVVGKPLPIVPSDRHAEFEGLLRRALSGERLRGVELQRRRKDGSMIDVALHTAPLHGNRGDVVGVMSVVADITERSRIERTLRETDERLRLTLGAVRDYAIFMIDPKGRVLTWGAGAERVTGYNAEEIAGRHVSLFYPPDEVPRGTPDYQLETAAREGRHEDEGWRVRKNGAPFLADVITVALRNEAGDLQGFVKVMQDITERWRTRQALQEAVRKEQHRADQLRGLSEAALALNAAGTVDEVLRILGVRARDILGATRVVSTLAGPDRPASAGAVLPAESPGNTSPTPAGGGNGQGEAGSLIDAAVLRENRALRLTAREVAEHPAYHGGRRSGGVAGTVPRGWLAAPLRGAHGECIGLIRLADRPGAEFTESDEAVLMQLAQIASLAIQNIRLVAAARQAEDQVRRYAVELERRVDERTAALRASNAELEAFSYTVSHDLRAPLRAMQGFADALLEDYGDRLDAQGLDYARRVARAAQRLDGMIQDLLAYSRIGRVDPRPAALSLSEVVSEVLTQVEADVRQRAAVVSVESGMPAVAAHRATLTQILANLMTNAVKFVAPGVTPRVRVRTEDLGNRVRLWVEDNGIGIAPEHQDRVFRVFERLHGVESYPGTGIGLAIVRKGTERMGGHAGLESTPGEGSRFWIEIPKAEGRS